MSDAERTKPAEQPVYTSDRMVDSFRSLFVGEEDWCKPKKGESLKAKQVDQMCRFLLGYDLPLAYGDREAHSLVIASYNKLNTDEQRKLVELIANVLEYGYEHKGFPGTRRPEQIWYNLLSLSQTLGEQHSEILGPQLKKIYDEKLFTPEQNWLGVNHRYMFNSAILCSVKGVPNLEDLMPEFEAGIKGKASYLKTDIPDCFWYLGEVSRQPNSRDSQWWDNTVSALVNLAVDELQTHYNGKKWGSNKEWTPDDKSELLCKWLDYGPSLPETYQKLQATAKNDNWPDWAKTALNDHIAAAQNASSVVVDSAIASSAADQERGTRAV